MIGCYDVKLDIFTFTVKKESKIIRYSIDVYENENGKNISEELRDIINEHIKYLKNIGAKKNYFNCVIY